MKWIGKIDKEPQRVYGNTIKILPSDWMANEDAGATKTVQYVDATAGTTAADVVLMCAASSTQNYVFPSGIAFSSGFSHWCVTGAAEANTTSPSNDVIARYVTS